ncbi:MAG TPA: matrixin family metalloprotease [Pyrinomonadaceae bacterium]|jgi:hypothetical protein
MTSLKRAFACIGLEGNVSVCSQLFGFRRKKVPLDPTGAIAKVSIRQQIQSLRNLQFNLNIIAVGSDLFSDGHDMQLDYTIYRLRQIYAQVGVAVGCVQNYYVPVAEALGHQYIGTEDAMKFMTHKWRVANDGISVFIPFVMSIPREGGSGTILGKSPVGGPCEGENTDDDELNGSVVVMSGDEQTAAAIAHEVGHYLGLEHRDEPNNVMFPTVGSNPRQRSQLNEEQGETIRQHCLIRAGCLLLFS